MATADACQWSATVDASWVTLETPRGTGPGPVVFHVAANLGSGMRAAAIVAQGQGIEIRQEAMALHCPVAVSPDSITFGSSGGTAPLAVSAPGGCRWTATTNDAWITLAGAAGEGNGPMLVSATRNTGANARTGALRVGDRTVSITQAGLDCDYGVSPTSQTVGAAGGRFDVTIDTSSSCEWRADSNDSWLSVSASRGTGDDQVTVSVAAHTGTSSRTGTLRVGGETVTVSQAAPAASTLCTYALSAQAQPVPVAGGSFTVNVTTTAACSWTASSSAPWVTIHAGASGTGPGMVGYTVAANPSTSARTATVQIADQTLTISQPGAPAPCAYSLSAQAQTVPQTGGSFSVDVTTAAGCSWTASSSAAWVTVNAGASGTGPGLVGYSVAANTSTSARTATLQIADQTLTISQPGAPVPCSYTVSPSAQSAPASGGSFQFALTTTANCQWTARAAATWVTLADTAGAGSTTIGYTVAPNPTTTTRTSSIQVEGQTHTITQAGASCTFTLDTTSQSAPWNGGSYRVNVKTLAGCGWTASANVPWLVVTAGSKGSGPGTVSYTVSVNSSRLQRSGRLTIGNQSVTVTQAGASVIP